MNEFERTSVRFFTFTHRRAADPGVADQSFCHFAWSSLADRNETAGTGTVVGAVRLGVLSPLHATKTAIPPAANSRAVRLRNTRPESMLSSPTVDSVGSRGPEGYGLTT